MCELWPRPAKVSAINRSIIKGGCTLAFEHTPGRAYFNLPRQVCGVSKGGGPAMRLREDEVWITEKNGGSRGGGQESCRIRDMCGKQPAGGTVGGPRRRGLQAFAAARQIIAMVSRVILVGDRHQQGQSKQVLKVPMLIWDTMQDGKAEEGTSKP